jgi:hypothetical protein
LIYFFSFDELKSFAFLIKQALKIGVGVCVYVVFLQNSEACVLHYWIFERTDLELVCAFTKMAVSVNPWKKTGNIIDFREGNYCLVELYLTAGYELTLEYAVVYLFVQDLLAGCWK